MKKVFASLSDVIHTYAQFNQDYGKVSNNNVFFYGDKLYSYGYHFCLANRVGDNIFLNSRNYSVSTSNHQSITRAATRQFNQIFCPYPENLELNVNGLNSNFESWKNDIEYQIKKLDRAKKPEIYLSNIASIENTIKKYCDAINIDIPFQIAELLKVRNNNEYSIYLEQIETYKAAQAAQAIKQAKKLELENYKKFISFKIDRYTATLDRLRYNKAENRIETTQAVKIPFLAAQKLHELIKTKKLNTDHKILDYSVIYIDWTANIVKIGCHRFDIKDLVKFGNKLFK